MKIFISGGSKSGKSFYAQKLAQKINKPGTPLYYIATMIPMDSEDESRVARHRLERDGWGFETVEAGHDIAASIDRCDKKGTFLLDSVTALLANEMFSYDNEKHEFFTDYDAYKKVAVDIIEVLNKLSDMIIVSDYIYNDAMIYDDVTEAYRRSLGYIDRQTARVCDVVLEFCCGSHIVHKGNEVFNGIKI